MYIYFVNVGNFVKSVLYVKVVNQKIHPGQRLENTDQDERETPPYGNFTIGVLAGKGNISMTMTERELLVLSLLEHCSPLIKKLARDWHLDYEDLRQDASINIMQILDDGKTLQRARNLPAVVAYCVRLRIINTLKSTLRHQAVSLDAPISEDAEVSLGDLLPDPCGADPAVVVIIKEGLQEMVDTIDHLKGLHGFTVRERYKTVLATYC